MARAICRFDPKQKAFHPHAQALYEDAAAGRVVLFQPALWDYEVANVVTRTVGVERMTAAEGERAIQVISGLQAVRLPLPSPADAYHTARKFRRSLWDSLYLECAEQNGATFWTADERLYNGVKDELSWVKWMGNYPLKRRRE